MIRKKRFYLMLSILLLCIAPSFLHGSEAHFWHNKERKLNYTPEGEEFVSINGKNRFTRAIYGTNTGFRFETSDYPEFGLYMPNLGGSIYLAISTPQGSKWINQLENIESRFKSGQRSYIITDKQLLGKGTLKIDAVALANADGLVLKYETSHFPEGCKLIWIYGGASHKRFNREGDIGVDPKDCFYIKAENCVGNIYDITQNSFTVHYGHQVKSVSNDEAYENAETYERMKKTENKTIEAVQIKGTFPIGTTIREADGKQIDNLANLLKSSKTDTPVIIAEYAISDKVFYSEMHNPKSHADYPYKTLKKEFQQGINYRTTIASRMRIHTPDKYFNTLGGIFAGAEDAIWESPGYLHGAIGWRVPLTGWRAAYLGDCLGIQDRARMHFDGYLNSQITDIPVTKPHLQDAQFNWARSAKEWGTPMYSDGYICRSPNKTDVMHHYDMNLVFIDELLWHLNWTGDMDYVRKVFPAIKRHLAWEKNTFDPDNDGLYDAYCCIWASDGLQYNSGKVTHSSAYNYRANKLMAVIAALIGEDPVPYEKEAGRILSAINHELWISNKGWWAEFKDNMGHGIRHDNAALWTIYHSIDSDVHDVFKAYQATRYIDTELPHIPIIANGFDSKDYYVVATTNWQPYMWSINNVAFAELAHTALAYWQSGRHDEAYKLFKGNILDAMYLGSGPGNITQISFYDAARGECYRDFADPAAMGVRALVQGMYGILPDLMNRRLLIKPGFPSDWDYADLETQNMSYQFKRKGNVDKYIIKPSLLRSDFNLQMELKARTSHIKSVLVNNKEVNYQIKTDGILYPYITFDAGNAESYEIVITWAGEPVRNEVIGTTLSNTSKIQLELPFEFTEIYDPQSVLSNETISGKTLMGTVFAEEGHRTVFVKRHFSDMSYWVPIDIHVVKPMEIINYPKENVLHFTLVNHTPSFVKGKIILNGKETGKTIALDSGEKTNYRFDAPTAVLGSNLIEVCTDNQTFTFNIINWNIPTSPDAKYQFVDITPYFNDKVNNIFEYGKYLSPRSPYTTLQVPTQGMGEWCHPMLLSHIDDSGFRKQALENGNLFIMPQGIPFATTGKQNENNIAFTTLWDNYPTSLSIPLEGKASKAYFLIAGSTYHMQSHILNGQIRVTYKDGTSEVLNLVLPDNLLPLDQDIFIDGWAFYSPQPRPWRVRLANGKVSKHHAGEMNIPMSNSPIWIEGGMATMLDLPLNPHKELASLTLETIANEVVIGLMGVTLERN